MFKLDQDVIGVPKVYVQRETPYQPEGTRKVTTTTKCEHRKHRQIAHELERA